MPPQVVEIRKFSDAALQAQIDKVLAQLPPDRKLAAVAHADGDGVSLSLVAKLGDEWSIAAAAYKPYNGKLSAEAEVVWSPF